MDKYFVYYDDGFYDDDCVGLETFKSASDALRFIEARIKQDPTRRQVDDYMLICGEEKSVEAYEAVTKKDIMTNSKGERT